MPYIDILLLVQYTVKGTERAEWYLEQMNLEESIVNHKIVGGLPHAMVGTTSYGCREHPMGRV